MWGAILLCSSLIRRTVAGFPSPQQFQLTISKEAPVGDDENPLGRQSETGSDHHFGSGSFLGAQPEFSVVEV